MNWNEYLQKKSSPPLKINRVVIEEKFQALKESNKKKFDHNGRSADMMETDDEDYH